MIYPASHYIVIYNHTRKLPYNQLQQFITGTPHSKGFVTFNVLFLNKKYIATAEEVNEGVSVSLYTLTNSQGNYNVPVKLPSPSLHDIRITKVFHLAFSQRDQPNNNYFALIGLSDEPSLVLWKFESDIIKDRLVFVLKLPSAVNFNAKVKMHISFSVYRNDNFCIIGEQFFNSYSISNKSLNPLHSFNLENEEIAQMNYGSFITAHCWFYDGNFAISTDLCILIFDSSFKILQYIETVNPSQMDSYVTAMFPNLDTLVVAGQNRRFEIYERKNDYLEKIAEKKVFDYTLNLNEKYDKATDNKLSEGMDKEKYFNFLSLAGSTGQDFSYVIATTSFNDLVQINLNLKELDKSLVKHLISPFHFDSIEGMDVCINKPYIITCSLDKNLRVWDYKKRSLTINKNFDEEMYSVGYHPNGMHAVVSFPDKILPLHVFYDEITNLTQNPISLKSNAKTKEVYIK